MSLVNIKQLRNLPNASQGAIIVYNGTTNLWSNQDNQGILISVGNSAQRPVSAVNGFIRYNSSSNLFEFFENGNWRNLDKIELSSLGISGESLFEYVSGNSEIIFKTIQGNGIIDIYSLSGTIYVSANAIKNISVTSLGIGSSLTIGVSGNSEIQLRTITGTGITEVTTVGDTVQVSAARATIETSSLGGVSLGLNVSAGTGNRNELRIRGLTGGGIIEVSALNNSIVISAASVIQNITISAFGGGINPILAISANREIHTRTFTGGGIVEVSAATDGRIIVSAQGIVKTLINQTSHGFSQGNVVYLDDNDGLWKLAISTSADTLGVAIVNLIDSNNFEAVFAGLVDGFTGLIPGHFYFTSSVSAGGLQINESSAYSNPILYALSNTQGVVLPYRPYENNPMTLLSISGLGTGSSVLRNVEGQTIVHRTLVNTSTIQVSASNSTIEFNIIPNNIAIPERIYFRAGNFDNPNNPDWYVSALAPAIADPTNNALTVRSFNNSGPYKGVGGIIRIPDNRYSNVRMGFVIRTPVSQLIPSGVVFGLGFRRIPNDAAITSWSVTSLPVFTIPANTNYQYFETPVYSISGLGLVNNQVTQFEIWRIYDDASDTLATEAYLLEFYFEFTG